jgi:hypothetical protein
MQAHLTHDQTLMRYAECVLTWSLHVAFKTWNLFLKLII